MTEYKPFVEIMEKPRILVIDDDESIRTQMKWALIGDYDISLAMDGEKAMDIIKSERPHLVTLDLGLPPEPEGTEEGLRLLTRILKYDPAIKVIVVSGNPDKSAALKAVSQGAHDFFTKPVDIEELKAILKRAFYVYTLEAEYRALQKQLEAQSFGEIIGSCQAIQEVFSTVRKVATTEVPVLITGESGTGKELVAKAIHSQSVRQKMPFIAINCGAIPENLMETELFGHEKGAFTGAHTQRAGRIEFAKGGTLFLDEIGELPLALQVKLLRFLQDHSIERVGGRETMEVDVRVMAATNRDLKKLVSEGKFREDLYYRIAVVNIELPPLRDRGDDTVLLARTFLNKFGNQAGAPKPLSQEAIEVIKSYGWPGNVRELENRIKRAVTFADGHAITPEDMGFEKNSAPEGHGTLDLKKAREALEIKLIKSAMEKHGGNVSRAAEELGLTRPTLHHLIKKYNIVVKQT